MNKFLFGFGGLLIAAGLIGLINHISTALKVAQTEQTLYGGSFQFMLLQMAGTIQPFLTLILGGGFIFTIAAFLGEYRRRSDLTNQLLQVLTNRPPESKIVNEQDNPVESVKVKQQPEKTKIPKAEENNGSDERIYWRG